MKLLRTIRTRRFGPFRLRRSGGARRMGGVRAPSLSGLADPAALEGKARAAFRSGFLGVASLGRSTLAQIVDASEAERGDTRRCAQPRN